MADPQRHPAKVLTTANSPGSCSFIPRRSKAPSRGMRTKLSGSPQFSTRLLKARDILLATGCKWINVHTVEQSADDAQHVCRYRLLLLGSDSSSFSTGSGRASREAVPRLPCLVQACRCSSRSAEDIAAQERSHVAEQVSCSIPH